MVRRSDKLFGRTRTQTWKTFLHNHSTGIAAMDFLVVPTIGFKLLFVLVILRHQRRRLILLTVTTNPTAEWIARQITEAFPWDEAPKYLIRDRNASYGHAVTRRLAAMGIRDHPTAPRSPWQNGHAERLIGSIRRECLDHIVVFGEAHLRRLIAADGRSRAYINGQAVPVQSLRALGERTVTLDCDVLQADGGTRTAAITGSYVALVDACNLLIRRGVLGASPLHGQVAAVSVGICGGVPVLDLDYAEDSQAETDMNVVMKDGGAFVEVQGTAEGHAFRRDELDTLLDLAASGIDRLHALQRAVLAAPAV